MQQVDTMRREEEEVEDTAKVQETLGKNQKPEAINVQEDTTGAKEVVEALQRSRPCIDVYRPYWHCSRVFCARWRFWWQITGQTANLQRLDERRWRMGLRAPVQSDLVLLQPCRSAVPSQRSMSPSRPGRHVRTNPLLSSLLRSLLCPNCLLSKTGHSAKLQSFKTRPSTLPPTLPPTRPPTRPPTH